MKELFGLDGVCVLVTGGTRGIGRAISLQLGRAGARVVANYARNTKAAEEFRSEVERSGLTIEVLRADLTLPKGMAAVADRMGNWPGSTISIVHCAATGVHRPLADLTLKHWDWTMSLNARAFFELVKTLSGSLGKGSAVVALSSAGALRAVPAYTVVGASKGALEAAARHMAVELAPRGIRVNVLSPGSVKTDAWDAFPDKDARLAQAAQSTPTGHLVTAQEVALAAQFLCSSASSGIIGQTIVVDAGARIIE